MPRSQINERLVIDMEIVLDPRGSQITFHGTSPLRRGIHIRFEEPVSATPVRFRAIHRQIRTFEQLLRLAFGPRNRYADARSDAELITVHTVRLAQKMDQPTCEPGSPFRLFRFRLDHGELIAAQTRNFILLTNATAQARRNALQ